MYNKSLITQSYKYINITTEKITNIVELYYQYYYYIITHEKKFNYFNFLN